MRPAARVGDWHRCFKQEPAPHIGGMILGPGCTNVVIGGLPAARGSSGAQLTPEMFDVADDKARLIRDNAQYIIRAARAFDVDARTLAAIILRENQDNSAIKEALELPMGFYSEDWGLIGKPSIGLAQIQVATARAIEEQGYIKPTSSDEGAGISRSSVGSMAPRPWRAKSGSRTRLPMRCTPRRICVYFPIGGDPPSR